MHYYFCVVFYTVADQATDLILDQEHLSHVSTNMFVVKPQQSLEADRSRLNQVHW